MEFVDGLFVQRTIATDLWDALSTASGKDISTFMQPWITQPGYPVVHVSKDGDTVTLTQQQFFVGPHKPSDATWPVPLNSADHHLPKLLDSSEITIPNTSPAGLRLNTNDTAHFLTNYDTDLFNDIVSQLSSHTLSPIDRLQILSEATLLARGGIISSATLIPLLAGYISEDNESVWRSVGGTVTELQRFVEKDTAPEAMLKELVVSLASVQYERLGWQKADTESEDDTKLRATIIALMLYGDNTDAVTTARELYDSTPIAELPAELRSLILASVVRHGDASVVDALMTQHNNTQSSELRQDISVGVTSTQHPEKIAELLDNLRNSKIVRPQDISHWLAHLCRNRASRDQTWQWLQENWSWISDTFQGDKSYDNFPRISAMFLSTQNHLDAYRTFFEPKQNIPALSRVISLGIGEIQGRVELIERDKEKVSQALSKQ
ncbi:MAG: hypothetical protein EOO17_00705 [Chloroflexi bacterium]|nr:MAG: hypothetical protein EOO17_00705 [Chloroflexota bacterium]